MAQRRTRALEELIEMQDKAITALQQAVQALQIALDTLQATRAEQGFKTPLPGLLEPGTGVWPQKPIYTPYVPPNYMPNTLPYVVANNQPFAWGGSFGITDAIGGKTVTGITAFKSEAEKAQFEAFYDAFEKNKAQAKLNAEMMQVEAKKFAEWAAKQGSTDDVFQNSGAAQGSGKIM